MNKILASLAIQLIFVNHVYSMLSSKQLDGSILQIKNTALSQRDNILEDIHLIFENPSEIIHQDGSSFDQMSEDEIKNKVLTGFDQKEKEDVLLDHLKNLLSRPVFCWSKKYVQQIFTKSIQCNYQNILRYLLFDKKINVADLGPLLLRIAAQKNDLSLLNLGLQIPDIDVNGSNKGWTPLIIAAQLGHKEALTLLLNTPGIDLDAAQEQGRTALFLAAEKGHLEIVKLLLEKGADINKEDFGKVTPVFVATQYGYIDIVKLLIENGANINQLNIQQQGLLSYSVAFFYPEIFKLLLKSKIDLDTVNQDKKNIQNGFIAHNKKNQIVAYIGALECYERMVANKWEDILSYQLQDVDVNSMKLKDMDLQEVWDKLEEYLIIYFLIIAQKEETEEALIKYNQLFCKKYKILQDQELKRSIKKYWKKLTKENIVLDI